MSEVSENSISALQSSIATDPSDWKLRWELARLLSSAGQCREALALFSQLAAERPDDIAIQRGLIDIFEATQRAETTPSAAPRATPTDMALAHLADARTCHALGDLQGAEAGYAAALRLRPDLVNALQHFCFLLLETRRSMEASELAQRILSIEPNNANAHFILGNTNANLGKAEPAIASYRCAIAANPELAAAHLELGILLRKLRRWDEAARHFERAVILRPYDPAGHIELAGVLERLNQKENARTHLIRAQQLQPLRIVPASKVKADFSALLLWAPGRANTPMHYLLEHAPFECRFLALVEGGDTTQLDLTGDVVVNLIADADQARDALAMAEELVGGLDKPIINHPRKIFATDRESTTTLLAGIPACRAPRTVRCVPGDLRRSTSSDSIFGVTLPFLLRAAGTHGGDDFERIDDIGAVVMFLAQHPADEYYVTEYVDYRSVDGYFRKYRIIFVNGEIVPYHLAISNQWKVHHFRTAMSDNPWMQSEEEAFLANPGTVFLPKHYAALDKIQQIFGLDFFGIDCAVDRDGNLLVFEVNACMLVQPDDSKFGYKIPCNARVKSAFGAMLERAIAARAGATVDG